METLRIAQGDRTSGSPLYSSNNIPDKLFGQAQGKEPVIVRSYGCNPVRKRVLPWLKWSTAMWHSQSPQLVAQVSSPLSTRSGLAGWWLNLTAPPRPSGILLLFERERIRKAELTSYSILAVFFFLLMLVSDTLTQSSARFAVIGMAIGLCVAALLNRAGWTRTAAYL